LDTSHVFVVSLKCDREDAVVTNRRADVRESFSPLLAVENAAVRGVKREGKHIITGSSSALSTSVFFFFYY